MQYDTSLTFREIHGSAEAFAESVKEIQELALLKTTKDGQINLRFLKIRLEDDPVVDIELTSSDDYTPGIDYISVSYTWDQSQAPAPTRRLPDYRVWDRTISSKSGPRPLKCPVTVFHRALQFAQAHKCERIWIDQECVIQDDPLDIERHLQVMDRIYKESRWTVAVLACSAPDAFLVEFQRAEHHEYFYLRGAVEHLIQDRYFTRTWTFLGRTCATSFNLLVPLPACFSVTKTLEPHITGSDFRLSLQPDGSVDWINFALRRKEDGIMPIWIVERYPLLLQLFEVSELCENTVTSDRLAILASVCRLQYKLNSTVLNDKRFSYSTCVLVQMVAHVWGQNQESERLFKMYAPMFMNRTIRQVLKIRMIFWQAPFLVQDENMTLKRRFEDCVRNIEYRRVH
jgi:hypothetical protein